MKTNPNPKPCNFDARPQSARAVGERRQIRRSVRPNVRRMQQHLHARLGAHSGPHRCDRHARG